VRAKIDNYTTRPVPVRELRELPSGLDARVKNGFALNPLRAESMALSNY